MGCTDLNGLTLQELRAQVIGVDRSVPLLDGRFQRYVYFDNAASTPTFRFVWEEMYEFLHWYSNVHRGSGFKSRLATLAYEKAREIVLEFVGGHPREQVAIFVKNTTEAINKLAYRLAPDGRDVVLTTLMEHHSNDLPWRKLWKTIQVEVDDQGAVDQDDLWKKLRRYKGRVRLLAVSGASNVTGIINPIHEFARWAHEHGAEILVDGAQLVPHRPVRLWTEDEATRIDYLAFSAHKIYAPFGVGVLIGPRRVFEKGSPEFVGGGTIRVVDRQEVWWASPPEKEEAGTPNILGAIGLSVTLTALASVGMEQIASHEMGLTRHLLQALSKMEGVHIYGPSDSRDLERRLGVVSFNLEGMPHAKLAAILNWEGAIGVRNGCFCAHPYLVRLLRLEPERWKKHRERILRGDLSNTPGAVRASFGCYNTGEEVDRLIDCLNRIRAGDILGDYEYRAELGEYWPRGFQPNYGEYWPYLKEC